MNIIEEIKKLNIPEDEFVIVGSSILGVKGIRRPEEIDDIDLLVTEEIFDSLKEKGWKTKIIDFDNKKCENLIQGIFEAGREYWDDETINFFNIHTDCVEEFDNIRFQSLEEFYKRKKAWGRLKDIEDVALIDRYLSNKGS